jgi:hypothetical protein
MGTGCFLPGLKGLGREVDRRWASSAEVKNAWSHNNIAPAHKSPSDEYFMAQKSIMKRNTHPIPLI